jgi:hypothetical protein
MSHKQDMLPCERTGMDLSAPLTLVAGPSGIARLVMLIVFTTVAWMVLMNSGCSRGGATDMHAVKEQWIVAPNGNRIYTRSDFPSTGGPQFPAVIVIQGGLGSGTPFIDTPVSAALLEHGYAVITFNPEGRGSGQPGDLTSEGSEDYNGHIFQDDLKGVLESAQTFSFVDPKRLGVVSLSYGISIASGCLARYADDPAVQNVRFLVDVEGPSDNYVIMADPWLLDDVIENDKTQSMYDLFHQFSLHYDVTYLHMSPSSSKVKSAAAWWSEREALQYIGAVNVPYLRLQGEWDHMQPPNQEYQTGFNNPPLWYQNKHAVDMVNAATSGSSPWTRINGSDIGNPPNTMYSNDAPPRYYSGTLDVQSSTSGFASRLIFCIDELFALAQ